MKSRALSVLALTLALAIVAACSAVAGPDAMSETPSQPSPTAASTPGDDEMMKQDDGVAGGSSMVEDDAMPSSDAMHDDTIAKPESMTGGDAMGNDDATRDDTMSETSATSGGDATRDDAMSEPGAMMAPKDRYVAYTPEALARATENGRAVLFFKARWCPTCRAADVEYRANLERIPADVTVLLMDYDTAGTLKRKYNITYQHTFVQVNASANEISRWNGGAVDELLANLK